MSKMSELSLVVEELRKCGNALIGVSETLADLFSGSGESESKAETPAIPEAKPVMRMIAKQISMDYFDDSTYQANRMMFWASCPSNGDFVFEEEHGEPLDPDKYLSMYVDWHDVTQWPTSSRQSEIMNAWWSALPMQKAAFYEISQVTAASGQCV